MDIESIDTDNPLNYLSPSEMEELEAAMIEAAHDPDDPYWALSEDDQQALECEHRSIVIGPGNTRSCEDCPIVWR